MANPGRGAEGALGALLVEGNGLPVAALGRHLFLVSDSSDARRFARGRSGPLEELTARPRGTGRGHAAGGLRVSREHFTETTLTGCSELLPRAGLLVRHSVR